VGGVGGREGLRGWGSGSGDKQGIERRGEGCGGRGWGEGGRREGRGGRMRRVEGESRGGEWGGEKGWGMKMGWERWMVLSEVGGGESGE